MVAASPQDPLHILSNSPILVQENCLIIDGFLHERLYNHPEDLRYRIFFSTDDYDYIVDTDEIANVDRIFSNHLIGSDPDTVSYLSRDPEDDGC